MAHPCFLGRSMDIYALLNGKVKEKTINIPIDELIPNPLQPRRHFDRDELRALSDSIKAYGLIQPVAVKRITTPPSSESNAKFEIIAGERRWRASRMAGLKYIKCTVFEADRVDSAMMALIENLQRSDLSFFEEALAMQTLMLMTEMTQTELAKALSISQSTLSNKLRLLRLSERERLMAIENGFSERHCRALVRIPSERERRPILLKIINERLQAPDAEKLIEDCLNPELPTVTPKKERKTKKKPKIKGSIRDMRLLFNTVDKAVRLLHYSGYNASWDKNERDGEIEVKIKIAAVK